MSTRRSISNSITAFGFAMTGAAVTSRLVFDHQPPSQPEDVVTYLATLTVAVIAGWWLANVLAWATALRRGVQLDRFTLPGTKRIAQLLLAAALSTSCVADASDDPVMVLVDQAVNAPSAMPVSTTLPPPTTLLPTIPTTTATTEAARDESLTEDGSAAEDSAEDDNTEETSVQEAVGTSESRPAIENHQVIVTAGDNLWLLAAETLSLHGVDNPSCGQVAEYWRLVVSANQVRSGNPNLIEPGEAITMPAFDLSGISPSASASSQRPVLPQQTGIGIR